MTTKTKAADLISRFLESDKMVFNIEGAKECALIVVDEILQHAENSYHNKDVIKGAKEYWQEVKQEIEKL